MKRKKIIALLLSSMLLCSLLLCGYSSEEPKVFDDADLLTQEEEDDLQQMIVKAAEKTKQDIIIVTTNDTKGKSAGDYADDFYDDHGFGYEEENGSGILLLIAMDIRKIYISTAGNGIEQYTDSEINDVMLENVYQEMVDGDYYDACWSFVYDAEEYGTNDEVAMNGYYDTDKDVFVEYSPEQIRENERNVAMARIFSVGGIMSRLLISMSIGAVAVLIMAIHVNSNKAPGGRAYLKAGGEHIRQRYDHRTHTTMTKRHIPRNNNNSRSSSGGGSSSSHRSSAGRSHGGGGRSF